MSRNIFLAECLVNTDRAGHRNVQALYDTHLGNDEITIRHGPDLFTHPIVFVTEYQGGGFGEIDLVQAYRIRGQVCGQYLSIVFTQFGKTFNRIGMLVYGQPFGGTAAAFGSEFLMRSDPGGEYINILYPHRFTGAHDG